MKSKFMRGAQRAGSALLLLCLLCAGIVAQERPSGAQVSASSAARAKIVKEVRHELLTLPDYGVFDWLEFEVAPDNAVILRGQVTAPPDKKSQAERAVEEVEGVSRVVNQIETLPVSPGDERLRLALYRSIYGSNSPLFRYGLGTNQAIRIIVNRGRATLKGVVNNEGDRRIAIARARSVPGLFAVNEELIVEKENRRRY